MESSFSSFPKLAFAFVFQRRAERFGHGDGGGLGEALKLKKVAPCWFVMVIAAGAARAASDTSRGAHPKLLEPVPLATNIDDAHKQVHTCPTERRRLFISQDLSTGGLLLATW